MDSSKVIKKFSSTNDLSVNFKNQKIFSLLEKFKNTYLLFIRHYQKVYVQCKCIRRDQ